MSILAHFGTDHILFYGLPIVGAIVLLAWAEKKARARSNGNQSEDGPDVG